MSKKNSLSAVGVLHEEFEKYKYRVIKKYIDSYDYYGLLSHGAPKDEFESEIQQLCQRIEVGMDENQIALIISDVMDRSFGFKTKEEFKLQPEKFMNIARRIRDEFDKNINASISQIPGDSNDLSIFINWDTEAKVWYAECERLGIVLESDSLEKLLDKVKVAVVEMVYLLPI